MNAAHLIREAIRRQRGEFTSADIWRAVKSDIQHLRWPNGAVIKQLWDAKRRREIIEVGIERSGGTIVKRWRKARQSESEGKE